jgi:hypothetical protein
MFNRMAWGWAVEGRGKGGGGGGERHMEVDLAMNFLTALGHREAE